MVATREDIRRAAGNAVMCGFQGTTLTAEIKELLREVRPLGVILFARNVVDPEQTRELCHALKAWRPQQPLLISVDQEGGRVARIRKPATEWPAMRTLGHIDDAALTEHVGKAMAQELRAMNIDINFAPVLDVDTNPANPIIGDRSFSADPAAVARHAVALLQGFNGAGVGGCGKHFPGHGDTDLDSHLALPRVAHTMQRLRAIEWPPFAACIAQGLDAIMTAHVVIESIDPTRPATLSPQALAPLRQELNFQGVIMSDDVEMKAVADHYSIPDMITLGLHAGIDLFLACNQPMVTVGVYSALVHAMEKDANLARHVLQSEQRTLRWQQRWNKGPISTSQSKDRIGCAAHLALAQQVMERAQTTLQRQA